MRTYRYAAAVASRSHPDVYFVSDVEAQNFRSDCFDDSWQLGTENNRQGFELSIATLAPTVKSTFRPGSGARLRASNRRIQASLLNPPLARAAHDVEHVGQQRGCRCPV